MEIIPEPSTTDLPLSSLHPDSTAPTDPSTSQKILPIDSSTKSAQKPHKKDHSHEDRHKYRRRSRDRSRDKYRDRHREKRHSRYYRDYSDSDSYEERHSRHSRRRHERIDSDKDYRREESRNDNDRRRGDRKHESRRHEPPAQVIKVKGRGAGHEQGLRSWNESFVKVKKPEEQKEEFKINEDWISNELRGFTGSLKRKSSPKWNHDRYEKINRDSDSEVSEGVVRMSPPVYRD